MRLHGHFVPMSLRQICNRGSITANAELTPFSSNVRVADNTGLGRVRDGLARRPQRVSRRVCAWLRVSAVMYEATGGASQLPLWR